MHLRPDRLATLYFFHPLQRLLRRTRSGIPILMYHSISDKAEAHRNPYFHIRTHPRVFQEHMRCLASYGYKTIGLGEAVRKLQVNTATSERLVVLTFDDGYEDFYTEAFPVLAAHGYTATVFLPTAYIGDAPRKFNGTTCLTWTQVCELHSAGIEFGSHTVTHPQLSTLPRARIQRELQTSSDEIAGRLGTEVPSFSYPYAFPETDAAFKDALRRTLADIGYRNGVCTTIGTARASDDPFFLRRLPVNSGDEYRLFDAKLSGSYDWLDSVQYAHKLVKGVPAQ
jgi:peptidoglycan/xylan/chitin deacetylase (PgdA/CDA1 family)